MPYGSKILELEIGSRSRPRETETSSHTIGPAPARFGHIEDLLRYENREWFISLRWLVVALLLAIGCVLGLTAGVDAISPKALVAASAGLALANCLFLLHHRTAMDESPQSVLLSLWLQIVMDLFVITFLVENMENCVLCSFTPLLFIPHLILGAITLKTIHSFFLVLLSTVLYVGCLVSHCLNGAASTSLLCGHAPVQVSGTAALFLAIWYLTRSLSKTIRARDLRLSSSHREVQSMFETSRSQMYHTAHQMKSPVVAIQSLLELYKFENEERLDPNLVDVLDRIETRCYHLLDSVSDMLFLAKIKAGHTVHWSREPVRLDCLIRTITEHFMDRIDARGLRLTLTVDPFVFNADHDAMERVVENLVENAINYSYPGGSIQITGKPKSSGYQLVVQDSGIGIKAEELEDIFKPHYRSIEAKRNHNVSTGLGMPIVRAATELFGWTLTVKSRPGKGSVFTLTFPQSDVSDTDAGN